MTMAKDIARASLVAAGVQTARQYGHTRANETTIFSDLTIRAFFRQTLEGLRTDGNYDSPPVLKAIDALIADIDEVSAVEPVTTSARRIDANLSDLFFNTDASEAENPRDQGKFTGYDDDKLRAHARQFLDTFARATLEWSGFASALTMPTLPPTPDDLVTALIDDFLRRH